MACFSDLEMSFILLNNSPGTIIARSQPNCKPTLIATAEIQAI